MSCFFTFIHWVSPETIRSPPGEARLTLWKPLGQKNSVRLDISFSIYIFNIFSASHYLRLCWLFWNMLIQSSCSNNQPVSRNTSLLHISTLKYLCPYGQLRRMRLCDPIWLLDVMIEMPGRFAWGTEVRMKEMGRGREGWTEAGGHRRDGG